jgi:predicted heme/steroid binding protein
MPTLFNYDGKPGYIYNAADDTWYELSGKTDTSGTFEWAGPHTHLSTITLEDHLVAKKGINNYLNPSARDASITSPVAGSICAIRQDGSGNIINQLQYYTGSSWVAFIPSQTGNEGKVLQTDGIITSWQNPEGGVVISLMLMGG